MVMSAPPPLRVVSSLVKLPNATPPAVPVVQKVIGPPVVANCLDSELVPALVVILPADLTKIPPTPAFRFALRLVAAVPVVVVEIAFDAVI
jgi:hypothetical protein